MKKIFKLELLLLSLICILFISCDTNENKKEITSFKFLAINNSFNIDYVAEINNYKISVVIPRFFSKSALTPTIEFVGKELSPSSESVQDFSKGSVIYTVTAENGSKAEYQVEVKNDLTRQLETANFIFNYENEKEATKEISEKLENSYSRICETYLVKFNKKLNVDIYTNQQELVEVLSPYINPEQLSFCVGIALDSGNIMMISPNNPGPNHSYEDIIDVAVHEFVHCVTLKLLGQVEPIIPDWLWEGIAVYESGQLKTSPPISWLIEQEPVPTIFQLEENFYSRNYCYDYSGLLVKYLVDKYGYEKLLKFIKNSQNFEVVFGLNKDQLSENWKKQLQNQANNN